MRRRLTREEAALWARVAGTVEPINPHRRVETAQAGEGAPPLPKRSARAETGTLRQPPAQPPPRAGEDRRPLDRQTLDATWDRKLAQGLVRPEFTIDLHGHSLDAAHSRLDRGIALALAQQARVILLVTGRPRPSSDHADRGERRGAIRAKFLDWLAGGPHAGRIAAVRPAHPRHGGAGAVYLVLRRRG